MQILWRQNLDPGAVLQLLWSAVVRYPLYWIRSSNFGDALNPVLYRLITGREAVFSEESPKVLSVGSIAHCAKPHDIIWGTGCMTPDLPMACDATTRAFVTRGPLTDDILRKQGTVPTGLHGSPSFVLAKCIPRAPEVKYQFGVLPHYVDYENVRPSGDVLLINPAWPPIKIIDAITQCQMIISSSLHGIIIPEAYGIPAIWVEFSDGVAGAGFKFRDYYLGTQRTPPEPLDWRRKHYCPTQELGYPNWKEPHTDAKAILELCPFDLRMDDSRWYTPRPDWHSRLALMAKYVPSGVTVLDIGAGNCGLKDLIPTNCIYVPYDLVARNNCAYRDLNDDKPLDFANGDIAILSGILEYVKNPHRLLFELKAKVKSVVVSYAIMEMNQSLENREHNGWVNTFFNDEIIGLFNSVGFVLKDIEQWESQNIYQFG